MRYRSYPTAIFFVLIPYYPTTIISLPLRRSIYPSTIIVIVINDAGSDDFRGDMGKRSDEGLGNGGSNASIMISHPLHHGASYAW